VSWRLERGESARERCGRGRAAKVPYLTVYDLERALFLGALVERLGGL
jgi:hypothetical protein